MKYSFRRISSISVVLALVFCIFPITIIPVFATNDSEVVVPVFATVVETGTIDCRLETSGDVLPLLGVNVHPEANGKIIEIFVSEGSDVVKGQKLAKINDEVQKAQFEQAQAAVTVSKAAIEMQKVMVESSQSGLVAAKAALGAAESRLNNLRVTKERLAKLFSEGAISRQQLDDVIAQHDSAIAAMTAAESDVKRAGDAILSAKMTLEMRRAELIQASANLHSVKVLLDNTLLCAPFNGVITARFADPGAMANMSAALFRIEQTNPVKIIGSIVEKDIDLLKVGKTEAVIQVDSIHDAFNGVVDKIYPAIDSSSRTGKIEILLANPKKRIRSGMFAKISLLVNTSRNVPIVSRDSLLRHDGKFYAFVIENNRAVKRQVKTGIVNEDQVEIIDGLKSGEVIIAKGLEFIREGSSVKINSSGDQEK